MIDLHLHTTASDGRLAPEALVGRAASAGLTTISVTDHDTTAGLPEATAAASRHGMRLVSGIEITAVEACRDVHVLGYFFDPSAPTLVDFLEAQRADRIRRIIAMADRLAALGCPVDTASLLGGAAPAAGRSLGRPQLADALVAAGHVDSRRVAFDTLLAEGRPAFVPRRGATVAQVSAILRAAGGLASLAHPVLLNDDEGLTELAAAGLGALEVWHSDHDAAAVARYAAHALRLGLGMSGGSDYHQDDSHHACGIGVVTLPAAAFADLEMRAAALQGTPAVGPF